MNANPPENKSNPWQPELDELARREAFAEQLGGPDRIKRQHDGGRYTIRERIALLADQGSFHEIGKIAGMAQYDGQNDLESFMASNFVFGRAKVEGRPVVIGGDDFTVRGGSADATIKEKHQLCERMANELRLPLLRLVEGSGGGGSVKTIETTGRANVPGVSGWETVVANMGTVPRVGLGLGSVA
ncbi:MAG: methylmalonyl-CoA carboxyltransferase, partial [Alphaproteobacteria bacterium]|nr:methylmalonyl-CoA carboxyltransferase [Alphaproteobacteria bacterium]